MTRDLVAPFYPAAPVVPATYRAGRFGYVLFLIFIPALAVWVAGPRTILSSRWFEWICLGYVFLAGFVIIWLGGIKLEIRPDGLSYSALFRGTHTVSFSDISMVVLWKDSRISHRWGYTANPLLSGKLVITPKPESGRAAFKIPFQYFSADARNQMNEILRPQEWDVMAE